MSATITLLVGPPGSGKSTYAHDQIYNGGDHGAATVRVSQDDQGKPGHMEVFERALHFKQDIIIDRMNFDKNQRNRYLEPARKAGYATRIIVVHCPLDTCLERCNKRENHPTIKDSKAASQAVNFFFSHYERVENEEADEVIRKGWAGDDAPSAIVCDLDGTLCNVEHRRHFVRDTRPMNELTGCDLNTGELYPPFKKNWPAFFAGIKDDTLNQWCADILRNMAKSGHTPVYCSGRGDNERKATEAWLEKHGLDIIDGAAVPLFMRNRQDSRRDDVVKEIILDFEILTRYKPFFMIDDRDQVVAMWRKRGYTCLQCDYGDF